MVRTSRTLVIPVQETVLTGDLDVLLVHELNECIVRHGKDEAIIPYRAYVHKVVGCHPSSAGCVNSQVITKASIAAVAIVVRIMVLRSLIESICGED